MLPNKEEISKVRDLLNQCEGVVLFFGDEVIFPQPVVELSTIVLLSSALLARSVS